jgi:hypothetical protein
MNTRKILAFPLALAVLMQPMVIKGGEGTKDFILSVVGASGIWLCINSGADGVCKYIDPSNVENASNLNIASKLILGSALIGRYVASFYEDDQKEQGLKNAALKNGNKEFADQNSALLDKLKA